MLICRLYILFTLKSSCINRSTGMERVFRSNLQEMGILLGDYLTVENWWGRSITVDDQLLLPEVVVFDVVIVCHCPICN